MGRGGSGLGWLGLVALWLACGKTVGSGPFGQTEFADCQVRTCAASGLNCGEAIDGCGGVLHCGSCGAGEVCGGGGAPNVCARAPCIAATCDSLAHACGEFSDGCGGTLSCGDCEAPETCGGGGVPHQCGQAPCTPVTCMSLGKNCGTLADGCGGTLACGGCAEGETCGGGGAANLCGRASCSPTTCEGLGKNCGGLSDGCGGALACGTCPGGTVCGGDGVPNVCGRVPCIPATCESLGKDCGLIPDGCGGTLTCGTCTGDNTCGGGPAPDTCGPATCLPTTCAAQGKNCGHISNGCGGLLDCGECFGNETCGGGGVANVCGTARCLPATCEELGKDCGSVPDGCGGILECGTCPDGQTCGGSGVPNVCGEPSACRPLTCGLLEKDCGAVADGCGGLLQCGTCPASEICGAAGVDNVCAPTGPVCVDQDLGSTLPLRLHGSTRYANDDHQASCGGAGAPDRGYLWTAPFTGTFLFDTAGSTLHTLVSLREGGCSGAELACATGGISYGGGAEVSAQLTAGQQVLVVVDSPTGGPFSEGDFELHIQQRATTEADHCFDGADNDGDRWVDCADTDCQGEPRCDGRGCADTDLGSALPVTYQGDTTQARDDFQGTCGAVLQADRAHLWTAPRAGTFVFDTAGSDAGNALYVLAGCQGPELACSSSRKPGQLGTPAVKLTLDKGQRVLVVVDGMAREDRSSPIRYTLHISEFVPQETGRCANGADDDADGHADAADPDCH